MEITLYKNLLRNHCTNNTPQFNLCGIECYCRVINIHDGDTFKGIMCPFKNNKYFIFTFRLAGIDTCELKSDDIRLHTHAIHARERLTQLMTHEYEQIPDLNENVYIVYVKCQDFDKYGRVLVSVYPDSSCKADEEISTILLNEKLAYKYKGQKKMTESEQVQAMLT
jgi:endonuclease YncB( thermonuclease family)